MPERPFAVAFAAASAAITMLLAATPALAADDAGGCARSMVRTTFTHAVPAPKFRDPRTQLPVEMTVQQRRELHPVLWPSEMSVRFTVRQWLLERNFACLEEAFADLEASQPRFPNGMLKQVEFLGGARDFVAANRGMTEAEIAAFMTEWRAAYPASLLAEVMGPRLLMGAAWEARGGDDGANVAPERMQTFRRLNAAAMKQLAALSVPATRHVMGHYVALRGINDNGATREQAQRFALEALRRYPHEAPLAGLGGDRLLPKWGGKIQQYEQYAMAVRAVVGPALADRTYAYLYTVSIPMKELHKYPTAQLTLVRAGLLDLARSGSFGEIHALQEFACLRRDAEALREAQALWARYASEPQLRPPEVDLNAECRQWERSLPAARATESPPAILQAQAPAAPPAPGIAPAQSQALPQLYSVPAGPWERLITPIGEVLSCTACEYHVQVLLAVGAVQASDSPWATNDLFLRSVESAAQQERTVRYLIASGIEDSVASGQTVITIVRTGTGQLGGLPAFEYEATVKMRSATLRQSGTVVVHKNRLLRIAVNRAEGPVGTKERQTVLALLSGIRLAAD